jgi:uncharacterized coiled-coil protein SlyX
MSRIDELEAVLQTEADLAEALAGVLTEKQQSIVKFHADRLGSLTQREQDLIAPFRGLESERTRLAAELAATRLTGSLLTGAVRVDELTASLADPERRRVDKQARRLKGAVQRILDLNQQNSVLMKHSLKFVKETLRLITRDHTRQLVDQRM